MSNQPTPRLALGRGMALVLLFLVWRAGAATQLNASEFERPLGTRRDALQLDEAQRIALAVRKVEQKAGLEAGYLAGILTALESLPPKAQVWLLLGQEDPRRQGLVRLQYLWYPRKLKAIEVLPRSVAVTGEAYLLVFGPIPELAADLKVVQCGPDWSLLGQ